MKFFCLSFRLYKDAVNDDSIVINDELYAQLGNLHYLDTAYSKKVLNYFVNKILTMKRFKLSAEIFLLSPNLHYLDTT